MVYSKLCTTIVSLSFFYAMNIHPSVDNSVDRLYVIWILKMHHETICMFQESEQISWYFYTDSIPGGLCKLLKLTKK